MHICTHELHVAPTQVLHLSQVTGLSPPWAISDAGALNEAYQTTTTAQALFK
jgi:hypothetical protein